MKWESMGPGAVALAALLLYLEGEIHVNQFVQIYKRQLNHAPEAELLDHARQIMARP